MSDYGQSLVNDAGNLLEGTWEYQGQENELKVRNIAYPDWRLLQEYATLVSSLESVAENGEDVDEEAIESLGEQAEDLDDFSWESEGEDKDFTASIIEEKLVRPDVDVGETSAPVLQALLQGMAETWQEERPVRDAKEEMPVEGNR